MAMTMMGINDDNEDRRCRATSPCNLSSPLHSALREENTSAELERIDLSSRDKPHKNRNHPKQLAPAVQVHAENPSALRTDFQLLSGER
jgi:hypothetical protein